MSKNARAITLHEILARRTLPSKRAESMCRCLLTIFVFVAMISSTGHADELWKKAFSVPGPEVDLKRPERVEAFAPPGPEVDLKPVFAPAEHWWNATLTSVEDQVFMGGPEGAVKVYRISTGELLHSSKPHGSHVQFVHSSDDGSKVLTIDEEGGLIVWEPKKYEPLLKLFDEQKPVHYARLSKDGWLAVGSDTLNPRVIDLASGETKWYEKGRHFSDYSCGWLAWSGDGKYLARDGKSLRILDWSKRELLIALEGASATTLCSHREAQPYFSFSPSNRLIAYYPPSRNSEELWVKVVSLDVQRVVAEWPCPKDQRITCIDWAPDSRNVAIGVIGKAAEPLPPVLLEVESGKATTLEKPSVLNYYGEKATPEFALVRFSPDGQFIVGGRALPMHKGYGLSASNSDVIWRVGDRKVMQYLPSKFNSQPAFSADSKSLLMSGVEPTVWRLE